MALADAGGELRDLRFVDAALTELLASWPPGADTGPDTIAARALWIAAVVWYARSFTTGFRTSGIAAEIASTLPDPSRADHAYFVALRDKHMAHSVNLFEQVATAVRLGPAPDFDLEGVLPVGLVMDLPTRQRAERLRALSRELTGFMHPRLRELGERLAASVTAMSPAERAALIPAAFGPPLTTTTITKTIARVITIAAPSDHNGFVERRQLSRRGDSVSADDPSAAPAAALVIPVFLLREAREAWEGEECD